MGFTFPVLMDAKSWAQSTSLGGVVGYLRIVPEEKFALLILSNGGRPLRKTADKAMQMFIPARTQTAMPTAQPQPLTESEASNYVGTYSNERTIQLFLKDGKLLMREEAVPVLGSVTGGYSVDLPVTKVGDHYFSIVPTGATLPTVFALIAGSDGKAEFMHIGGRP